MPRSTFLLFAAVLTFFAAQTTCTDYDRQHYHHARAPAIVAAQQAAMGQSAIPILGANTSLEARAPSRSRQRRPARQRQDRPAAKGDRPRGGSRGGKGRDRGRQQQKTVKQSDKEPEPAGAIPSAIQEIYDSLSDGKKCENTLDVRAGGFSANGHGGNYAHYCGDKRSNPNLVYWMSNMDVDCDGASPTGPCSNDGAHQTTTSFTYQGRYIDAQKIPYVVINDGKDFSPSRFGIQPLATVGVICDGKLVWAIWADSNDAGNMGEGSVKLAQTCFGKGLNGNAGYDQADVLYFAFTGQDAVDQHGGADYSSLSQLGQTLLGRLG